MKRAAGTFMASDSGLGDTNNILTATKSTPVYYYETNTGNNYVIFVSHTITGGDSMYNWQPVDTRKGAKAPAPAGYSQIHFGVWAGLTTADSSTGENEYSELGIGFVQNFTLDGMTETMPNHGTATYNGNWVATVQEMDPDGDGDITLQDGTSSMIANFSKGDVDITLTDLATLEGTISESTFGGSKAPTIADNPDGGLNASGKFTGSFSGAFFGTLAAEAGGVFKYESDDNEDGAFRGAFGGQK